MTGRQPVRSRQHPGTRVPGRNPLHASTPSQAGCVSKVQPGPALDLGQQDGLEYLEGQPAGGAQHFLLGPAPDRVIARGIEELVTLPS
jgi:hypothetical protein